MLKKSITKRMFIGITAVVVGFAVIILLANTLLLSPLYYRSLEKSMIASINELAEIDYENQKDVWIEDIFNISSGSAYDVIVRYDGVTLFSTSMEIGIQAYPEPGTEPGLESGLEPKSKEAPGPLLSNLNWKEVGNVSLSYSTDPRNNNEFMVCMTELDNRYKIFLTQPVAPVNAGIAQSNKLLIICTAAVLLLSVVFAFRFSKGFTKPIKAIQSQVKKISDQDFSSELEINTGDELENLGNDVNILSSKLETALEELHERNKQLELDIQAQRSFISNASHELRTPLSLIKGYADELNSGYISDTEQQKIYHNIISEESTKIKRLLNEMLDLSRLESGRMDINKEEFKVNELINSFFEKYAGFVKENNLNIELKLREDLICIHDVMRFEQILANYISNASKYSDSKKHIIISSDAIDGNARVSVFNYGSQIDEDSIEHIWDGFYKADNSRTRKDDSYGLGLSIVKAIQQVAGYEYGVINHEDGVEFWFDIKLV